MKIEGKYKKLRNLRDDFIDKASTAIAKRYDAIFMKNLNVQGVQHDHYLSKSITDLSFYAFKQNLRNKAERYGKDIIEIGRFDPSSKMCSGCGNIKHDMKLSDRIYHCDACGLTVDRDFSSSRSTRKMRLIKVGLVQPEFTPEEIATLGLYGIYPYKQMSVYESGSSEASAEE